LLVSQGQASPFPFPPFSKFKTRGSFAIASPQTTGTPPPSNLTPPFRTALAAEIATKCGLDAEGVFAAAAVASLRVGDVDGAMGRARYFAKGGGYDFGLFLDSVESALPTTLTAVNLTIGAAAAAVSARKKKSALLKDVSSVISAYFARRDVDATPPYEESARFDAAFYFCERIGGARAAAAFAARRGAVRRSVAAFLGGGGGAGAFGEAVVAPCHARGSIASLRAALVEAVPGGAVLKDLVNSACSYLRQQRAFNNLLAFHLLARDFQSAARAHLLAAAAAPSPPDAERHLVAAEGLLARCVPEGGCSDAEGDADARLLRLTSLQRQVNSAVGWSRGNSLFSPAARGGVAAEVFCVDATLALRIVNEFKLSARAVAAQSVGALARTGKVGKIEDVLKSLEGTVDAREWQELLVETAAALRRNGQGGVAGRLSERISDPRAKATALGEAGRWGRALEVAAKAKSREVWGALVELAEAKGERGAVEKGRAGLAKLIEAQVVAKSL
jgi:hypothetical protein